MGDVIALFVVLKTRSGASSVDMAVIESGRSI